MKAYAERNLILRELGYRSYREYLNSPLWASIRDLVLSDANGLCWACQRPATQVHHRRYTPENLAGETTAGLVAVCGGCHRNAEFSPKRGKTELGHANKRLSRRRKFAAKNLCWENDANYRSLWREKKQLKKLPRTPGIAAIIKDISKELRRMKRSVIASTPTYATGDAIPARGAIHESATEAVRAPSQGPPQPIPT